MLVLSRKVSESIQIGDNVKLVVRRIAGGRVTLAIHAPKEVRILRGELEPFAREFEAEADSDSKRATNYEVEQHRLRVRRGMMPGPSRPDRTMGVA